MERERLIKYKKAEMFFKIFLEGNTAQKTFYLNSIAEKFKGYAWVVVEQAGIENVTEDAEDTVFFHSSLGQPYSQDINKQNNMNSVLFFISKSRAVVGSENYTYSGNNFSGCICNFTSDSIEISLLDRNHDIYTDFDRWYMILKIYPLYEK